MICSYFLKLNSIFFFTQFDLITHGFRYNKSDSGIRYVECLGRCFFIPVSTGINRREEEHTLICYVYKLQNLESTKVSDLLQ